MCKFLRLIVNRKTSNYRNIIYLPEVFDLYKKYSRYITDDYTQFSIDSVIEQIEKTCGYFWVILSECDEFAGFVFLDNWVGNNERKHSAELTTCFKKDFWGDFTKKCAKKFIKYCFKNYGLKKIKAAIFPDNKRVLAILKQTGFLFEAVLKGETLRNNELQDVHIYSIEKE